MLADDQIEPAEALRAYHADLQRLGIRPYRSLEEDSQLSSTAISYGGTARPGKTQAVGTEQRDDLPDFDRMTSAEKVQWNLDKWRRILGD